MVLDAKAVFALTVLCFGVGRDALAVGLATDFAVESAARCACSTPADAPSRESAAASVRWAFAKLRWVFPDVRGIILKGVLNMERKDVSSGLRREHARREA